MKSIVTYREIAKDTMKALYGPTQTELEGKSTELSKSLETEALSMFTKGQINSFHLDQIMTEGEISKTIEKGSGVPVEGQISKCDQYIFNGFTWMPVFMKGEKPAEGEIRPWADTKVVFHNETWICATPIQKGQKHWTWTGQESKLISATDEKAVFAADKTKEVISE